MQKGKAAVNMKKSVIYRRKDLEHDFIHPGYQKKESPRNISLLINSVYYFIECVFILELASHYRLIVLHRGKVLTDTVYRTIRGARIAFAKLYRSNAWRPDIKPYWTPFYNPDEEWLQEKTIDLTIADENTENSDQEENNCISR